VNSVVGCTIMGAVLNLFWGAPRAPSASRRMGRSAEGDDERRPWVAMNYAFGMRKPALTVIDGVDAVVTTRSWARYWICSEGWCRRPG
jgi:hypothetical protein